MRTRDDIRQKVVDVLSDTGVIATTMETDDTKIDEVIDKTTNVVYDEYNATYAIGTTEEERMPSDSFIYGAGKATMYDVLRLHP